MLIPAQPRIIGWFRGRRKRHGQGPFYWTQSNGVVLLRDSSGNILGPATKQRPYPEMGPSSSAAASCLALPAPFRWANGVAAPIPQLAWIVSSANSVSSDGTIIAGDISQTGSSDTSGFTLTGTKLEIIPPSSLQLSTSRNDHVRKR